MLQAAHCLFGIVCFALILNSDQAQIFDGRIDVADPKYMDFLAFV
jgi:hypothetical protein